MRRLAVVFLIITSLGGCTSDTESSTTTVTKTVIETPEVWIDVDDQVVAAVRASSGLATNAVDDDPASSWTAEGEPPQWIELRLREQLLVVGVEVTVAQGDDSTSVHTLTAGAHEKPGMSIESFQTSNHGEERLVMVNKAVEFIRLTTTESSSEGGWSEIFVIVSD